MPYTKENRYKRIIDIQELTLQELDSGLTKKEIYYRYIEPRYRISMRAYTYYLACNAKRKLKEINEEKRNLPRQLQLFE